MNSVVLVGAGGHCRACVDVIESTNQFRVAAIVGCEREIGSSVLNYPVEHSDADLPSLVNQFGNVIITVGQIKSNAARVKLYDAVIGLGAKLPSIVSPLAYVSRHATVGQGSIVMHHAILNAGSSVGENCIVNTRALIEHDACVGNHCHISTGAILNGGVVVKDHCFVGSGAVTMQGITIEANSVVGAASWVPGYTKPRRR